MAHYPPYNLKNMKIYKIVRDSDIISPFGHEVSVSLQLLLVGTISANICLRSKSAIRHRTMHIVLVNPLLDV